MRKLKIDFVALEFASEDVSGKTDYFLDLETGEVLSFPAATRSAFAGMPTVRPDSGPRQARYLPVLKADSRTSYRDIEDFVATVSDRRLQERLRQSISGQGAFRRFKTALASNRRERERWFRFKSGRVRERLSEWLALQDIELLLSPEEQAALAPGEDSTREKLLSELAIIVEAACKIPGVIRIALIGSLATDAPAPRDADLLISVADDAALAPIGKLGRRWRTHAQGQHCTGDIFLADPEHNYLGRTCPWRVCRAGVNERCDAQNCGVRPYLHDDLSTIRLPRQVIATPPIELWPELVARVAIPDDVEDRLVKPLHESSNHTPPS